VLPKKQLNFHNQSANKNAIVYRKVRLRVLRERPLQKKTQSLVGAIQESPAKNNKFSQPNGEGTDSPEILLGFASHCFAVRLRPLVSS